MTERPIAPSTLNARAAYQVAVDRLRSQYRGLDSDAPIRLAKRTSNLFRMRDMPATPGLDVAAFSGVIEIDPVGRTADVLGMTTYEDLVDATLRHGLMPLVVPELKTITLGGAVTGLGIESTSFRNGCPHESVIDFDVLTGDGRVITVTPDGPHADLFAGFPNSYGTLGYALRLRIELEPVKPFVALEHYPHHTTADATQTIREIAETARAPRPLRRLPRRCGLQPGSPDRHGGPLRRRGAVLVRLHRAKIYYKSLEQRSSDYLTIRDYLWRWDTDWFWCSGALGVQHPMVRPFLPRRLLRSDVYWKVVGFERRHGWKSGWDAKRGHGPREPVIQDVEVPIERLDEFLEFFHNEIGVAPVWLCPLRQRSSGRDVGSVRARPGDDVREPRLLVVGGGAAGAAQGPPQPADRGGRGRSRGKEIPLLLVVLRGRRVLEHLQRGAVRAVEEGVRPARPAARSVCQVCAGTLRRNRGYVVDRICVRSGLG